MSNKKKEPDGDLLIKNYILQGCKNAKQAAIDAHYSPKTAEQSASRVLRGVKAREAIARYQKIGEDSFIWSKEKKLKMLQDTAENAATVCDKEGDFNNGKMFNHSAVIAAIKEHNLMQGDNAPTVTENTHIITADDSDW